MRRFVFLIVLLLLVSIPLIFFIIDRRQTLLNRATLWPLVQKTVIQDRYSVESDVTGYTIKLIDTKFLDYIVDNVGVLKPNGVVDPETYQGGSMIRHTVSHIKFVIIPRTSKVLVAVPGQKDMAAYADYAVSGDALLLRVQFNPNETPSVAAGQHTLDAAFLLAALQTVEYAHGLSTDPRATLDVYLNVQQGITIVQGIFCKKGQVLLARILS